MNYSLTQAKAKELLENKLLHFFGVNAEDASYELFYRSIAMLLTEMMEQGRSEFTRRAEKAGAKRISYLSMEFLMGRSLKNNLYNLGLQDTFEKILKEYGVDPELIYDCEPDAGLGNGGLGRLAACYLDGLATDEYPARGYSILYEYGIFRQKIIDSWQEELPDNWLPGGDVWLVPREESSVEVKFNGKVIESWDNHFHHVEIVDYTPIKAVPYDMFVSGKDGKGISVLRLWSAKAPGLDMAAFNQGDYMRAVERNAMAEVISKVLYPADNHPEGKSLRLKQQYFLVSASIQDIVRRHLRQHGTLDDFAETEAIHINDTHPSLSIPELMRILLDECGYGWDDAWKIVSGTIAYTNHTVMKEALECWSEDLVKRLIPRIYEIIKEIDNRFRSYVWNATKDADYVERTAIISNGIVRMANLDVASCHSVNGVSALHSEILKNTVFNDFYRLAPTKFTNVTNGIAFRRWLCQSNPKLSSFVESLIGPGFILNNDELKLLRKYENDPSVLSELEKIKRENKARFSNQLEKAQGISLDPDSLFDVQVKRLHEYKRQLMNALNILYKYIMIKENPNGDYVPHTYIFGAKAAPGYYMAKKIINFICELARTVNSDPVVSKYLKVAFVEDYNVTMAERLMPAAEISEQISLAGTEASGTSNMKLMLNGAVTLGTEDGANVEIHEAVGDDNIIIFGMNTNEVDELKRKGYDPMNFYMNNIYIRKVIDYINNYGLNGKKFPDISNVVHLDPYMTLADFEDYKLAQEKAEKIWLDKAKFDRMSLVNIAESGRFSADRAINEYAQNIWHTKSAKTASEPSKKGKTDK